MVLANLTCTTSLNSKKIDAPFTLTRSANIWIVLKKGTDLLQVSAIFAKGYLLRKVSCYEGNHKVLSFRSPAGDQSVAQLKEIRRILRTCASSDCVEYKEVQYMCGANDQ